MPPEPPSYPDSSGAETDAAAHPSEPEALHGGCRWAELGWWGVLALLVVGTVYVQAAGVPRPEGGGPPPAERTDLILQAEYLLGVAGIAERAAPGML
ncbi:MAG: hypothetical protein MI919_31215, partial [Holophagales bacterium]|nr:hypothetical protein [Holophagales bacterium]